MPLELVERKLNFDNNPRLAKARGFFCASAGAAKCERIYEQNNAN